VTALVSKVVSWDRVRGISASGVEGGGMVEDERSAVDPIGDCPWCVKWLEESTFAMERTEL
jgi:hypothetical protein